MSIEHEDTFVPATVGVPEAARLPRAAIGGAAIGGAAIGGAAVGEDALEPA